MGKGTLQLGGPGNVGYTFSTGLTTSGSTVSVNYGAGLSTSGTQIVLNIGSAQPFTTVSGALAIGPGTGMAGGTLTFGYATTGPYMQVGAAGVTLADNYTTPLNTVAISSSGLSIATPNTSWSAWVSGNPYVASNQVKYTTGGVTQNYVCILATSGTTAPPSDPTHWAEANLLSITSTGLGIYGPTGSLTCTSGGIVITAPGTNAGSVTISGSGGILIQNLSGSSYVQVTSGGVSVVNGTLTCTANSLTTIINNALGPTNYSSLTSITGSGGTQYQTNVLSSGFIGFYGGNTKIQLGVSGGSGNLFLFDSTGTYLLELNSFINNGSITVNSMNVPTPVFQYIAHNQTSNIGSTNITQYGGGTLPAGLYQVQIYVTGTMTGGGALEPGVFWTDQKGNPGSAIPCLITSGASYGSVYMWLDGSRTPTFNTSLTSGGISTFDIAIVVFRII